MVDARYAVTEEERQAILAACFDEAGACASRPAREKRKLVVLSAIAEQFKPADSIRRRRSTGCWAGSMRTFPTSAAC